MSVEAGEYGTLCIVTETSWKISDIGSDNFQMISVIFHMMFGK